MADQPPSLLDSLVSVHAGHAGVSAELDELFDELDQLLKNPDSGAALAERGVNVSLAMTAAEGLRAYLRGDKAKAAEELGTAAEEIATRLARSSPDQGGAGGGHTREGEKTS
jgi:hypothetical protein